ncbi:MAG: MFS transporter [Pseudobutyrivibrio sp.]|nr:MFS transporter [Pseudobutyrivibrio sp.]
MQKFNTKRQIGKLYLIDGLGGVRIAGASWVALLVARGFTTVEIGIIESIFHVVSMTFEIPSGAFADVLGRKKSMMVAQIMSVLSGILMIVSNSFWTVAFAIGINALSYNFASGSREALAYDSLKENGKEEDYENFASTDSIIYEITSSLGTLLAGLALALGYKKAYAIDIILGVSAFIVAARLIEVNPGHKEEMRMIQRTKEVFVDSFKFLKENRIARLVIIYDSLIGAVSVLLFFFMQAKLPVQGLPKFLLGPALFAMGLGGVIGAKIVTMIKAPAYKNTAIFAGSGTVIAIAASLSGIPWLMIFGGFLSGFAGTFIEIRSDVLLNNMIPSESRATLVSVASFTFSVIMIVMSPLAGMIFS